MIGFNEELPQNAPPGTSSASMFPVPKQSGHDFVFILQSIQSILLPLLSPSKLPKFSLFLQSIPSIPSSIAQNHPRGVPHALPSAVTLAERAKKTRERWAKRASVREACPACSPRSSSPDSPVETRLPAAKKVGLRSVPGHERRGRKRQRTESLVFGALSWLKYLMSNTTAIRVVFCTPLEDTCSIQSAALWVTKQGVMVGVGFAA